jgi:hypothetical protein
VLREVVDSSSLRSVGYDASTSTLEVEFHNGSVYHYCPVPKEMWQSLRRAKSKGQYFQAFVRDHFETRRVS